VKKRASKPKRKTTPDEYDFSRGVRGKYTMRRKLDFLVDEARTAVRKGTLRDWPKSKA
jgi:hypothetical protein